MQEVVSQSCCRNSVKQASKRLLDLVLEDDADQEQLGQLVDELTSAQVPFREKDIGGGPWQVGTIDTKSRVLSIDSGTVGVFSNGISTNTSRSSFAYR